MRQLLAAVLALGLVPALALADEAPPAGAGATAAAPTSAPAAVASSPAPAASLAPAAPTASLAATDDAKKKKASGFRMGVGIDHSLSHATFTKRTENSQLVGAVSLAPSYGFELAGINLAASANGSFSYEYTVPNGMTDRRWNYGDIALGLSAPAIFKDDKLTGIAVSPRIGFTLPISLGSWNRGTITNGSLGLGLSRAFGKVNVGASVGASKGFYKEVTRNITEEELNKRDAQGNAIYFCRTDSDNCGLRGIPRLWSLSGGVNVGYSPIERLSLGMGLNLSTGYAYEMPVDDEYASQKLDENGNSVIRKTGRGDNMVGVLSASYQLTDTIGLSFSMGTGQPPLSADNKRLRFPFFSNENAEDGATNYSLALSGGF